MLNVTRVFNVQRGTSVNISCNYNQSIETEIYYASLNMSKTLCFNKINNNLHVNQPCNGIRFIWVVETKEITFELSNLQINNSGTYTCTVERQAPPPTVNLGTDQTTVRVVGKSF